MKAGTTLQTYADMVAYLKEYGTNRDTIDHVGTEILGMANRIADVDNDDRLDAEHHVRAMRQSLAEIESWDGYVQSGPDEPDAASVAAHVKSHHLRARDECNQALITFSVLERRNNFGRAR